MSSRTAKSLLLGLFIWGISLSYGFMDWIVYRQRLLGVGDGWKLYLQGGIEAPWQYRIGPWIVVDWLNRLFHLKPYNTLTLVDVLCLALALWTMLTVLRRSSRYRALSPRTRWLAIAGSLFFAEYYLAWGHWYQTTVTVPSILFVALSLALIGGKIVRNQSLACLLLLALAWIQGLIRADVAVVLHAGFFLAAIFGGATPIPLGRARQAATSLLAALLAGCVQLYLMLVRYPHTQYTSGGVIRLLSNVHPGMWLTMLLALVPFWILLGLLAAKRYQADGPERLLLTAAVLYLGVWATAGLLDEVRIFLPFAFALIPATAMALIGLIPESSYSEPKTIAPV